MTDQARADTLAQAVARLRGIDAQPFGAQKQVAYGTLLFKWVPERGQLVAAVLVSDDPQWDQLGDQFAQTYLKSVAARSDPRIGGLFDTGGGAWMFERDTGRSFLFRAFPLDTPPAAVSHAIDAMAAVVPAWETRWDGAVAEIAQGKASPPPRRVTLADDPYADRF